MARPAPLGPEVDEHRSRPRSLDHVLLESGLRHVHVVSNAAARVDHSLSLDHVGSAARDERCGNGIVVDPGERRVLQVDLDVRPRIDADRTGALLGAEAQELDCREHAAATRLAACDPLELAELLERIDAHVRVRSDAEGNRPRADPFSRKEAVSEIGLGRRARADDASARGEQIKLGTVRMRRVDDGGPLAEAARACKQLDRAAAVLCQALLDLARLLVGVHVERERLGLGVAPDLLEPVGGAGANGVRSDSDAESRGPQVSISATYAVTDS